MRYLLLLLLSVNCYADGTWTLRGGSGISSEGVTGTTKILGFRTESPLRVAGLHHSNEVGGWYDNQDGHRSSLYTKLQLGIKPTTQSGWFAKLFFGPALITSPDTVLGSVPQFSTDLALGLSDDQTAVSLGYMHMSNAGLFSDINKGRDYLVLEASFSL